jgi:hypothetical protein
MAVRDVVIAGGGIAAIEGYLGCSGLPANGSE